MLDYECWRSVLRYVRFHYRHVWSQLDHPGMGILIVRSDEGEESCCVGYCKCCGDTELDLDSGTFDMFALISQMEKLT